MGWKDTSSREAEGLFLTRNAHIQKCIWASTPNKPISRHSPTGQKLGPGACHVEGCWQTLNRGCKLWVSQRAIRRERQEICSSVINASEKSEQRVTSPQLITTRGKGRTNRYPDPVIHIWLASIVLLARLPRLSVIPMACFWLCSCQARVRPDSHVFHSYLKRNTVRNVFGDRS